MAKSGVAIAFGRRLLAIRLTKAMTQEVLAGKVGLDRSYVGSVERGERNVSLENIVRLAIALDVPPSELMTFDHRKGR